MASDPAVLADRVTDQLAALAAGLREQGSRVGIGELLTAHRALEAVDCTSREDARLALRAVLCSERGDLAKFERVFYDVFGDARVPLGPSPFDEFSNAGQPLTGSVPSATIRPSGMSDAMIFHVARERLSMPLSQSSCSRPRYAVSGPGAGCTLQPLPAR